MALVSGCWTYSKQHKRYFTLVDGFVLLEASANADGTLSTKYSVCDWRRLRPKAAASILRIQRKHLRLSLARLKN
jgi:hypothetical protein